MTAFKMTDQEEYRILLQDLHSELPDEDIKGMKFLAQPLIKKRLYESIKDGLGLFGALEDCTMLSRFNLVYLSQLLETVGRMDLQARITEEIECDAISGEESLICPFRKLLFNLHKEIEDHDLMRMRYLHGTIPKRVTVDDPLDLFGFMIRELSLAPHKLDNLRKILSEISRQDLVEEIMFFEDTVNPDQCNYSSFSKETSGPKFEPASLESSSFPSSLQNQEPSSQQEWGPSYQDTEHQQSGFFQQESLGSSSQATGVSSWAHSSGDSIEELKAHNVTGASGEPATATGPGLSTATITTTTTTAPTAPVAPAATVGGFVCRPIPPQAEQQDVRKTLTLEDIEMFEDAPAVGTGSSEATGATGNINTESKQMANAALDLQERYKMSAEPRGLCLIIDVQKFSKPHLRFRYGSQVDKARLHKTFTRLKFVVTQMDNPTAAQIDDCLLQISQLDHSAYDCLVICVLSHGGPHYFYGSDGVSFDENRLFGLFSAKACPSLANKPKLFFFSYCRGLQEQEGVPVVETDCPTVVPNPVMVPDLSDFLFGYATPQHFVSYRNRSNGTFYIEVLTDVLDKDADRLELQHLLLRVNRLVSNKPTTTTHRQIPKPEHTLKRQLYFL
ncbi:hypothetical protein EGW08_021565 [Elysia chlorotica]|uniref:Caspase-8 n=1 Tax=Elysia chlorotica TaxID=188477 RepID=A0A3S0ZAT8_ELYCH|nr:hypothetical protein EGW08_021565 [Elysia chlorotica]